MFGGELTYPHDWEGMPNSGVTDMCANKFLLVLMGPKFIQYLDLIDLIYVVYYI